MTRYGEFSWFAGIAQVFTRPQIFNIKFLFFEIITIIKMRVAEYVVRPGEIDRVGFLAAVQEGNGNIPACKWFYPNSGAV